MKKIDQVIQIVGLLIVLLNPKFKVTSQKLGQVWGFGLASRKDGL